MHSGSPAQLNTMSVLNPCVFPHWKIYK